MSDIGRIKKIQQKFGVVHLVFTDGASSGNPGPGGWAYLHLSPEGKISENSGFEEKTTNNRMELRAIEEALLSLLQGVGSEPVQILTDSAYVIQGMTLWTRKWEQNGWKTQAGADVLNQDLWQSLLVLSRKFSKIQWGYIPGHAGYPGNERVDFLAVQRSLGKEVSHFSGSLDEFESDLSLLPEAFDLPEQVFQGAQRPVKKSVFYLSSIGGIVTRHDRWEDCERHVKGRSGAKYKKVQSEAEAEAILAQWGVSDSRQK